MTIYNDDDVQRALDSAPILDLDDRDRRWFIEEVLDAVLPGYLISLAGEIEAKRPCKCTSCSAIKNLIREKASE